jgi:hypothetical protein
LGARGGNGRAPGWDGDGAEESHQGSFFSICLVRLLILVQPPTVKYARDIIQVPAIVEPHQGTSYNPPVEAHQELILKAYEAEEKRLREAEKLAEVKKKMEEAHAVEPREEGLAAGMKLAEKVLVEEDEAEEGEEVRVVKSVPDRKTQSQKNKAKRLLAEVCSIPCPSTTLIFIFVETRPGGASRAQTDDGIHKQRKDLASEHSAAPIRTREEASRAPASSRGKSEEAGIGGAEVWEA